jgi:uncharacterized protein
MAQPKMVFINLPVADLKRSIAFYTALGFTFNPAFTDDTATCMVLNQNTFCMLLSYPKFDGFLTKPRPDSKATTGALYALSLGSKAEVDAMLQKVSTAGGAEYRPVADLGFMYTRAFADPDGHVFELFFMDSAAMPQPA